MDPAPRYRPRSSRTLLGTGTTFLRETPSCAGLGGRNPALEYEAFGAAADPGPLRPDEDVAFVSAGSGASFNSAWKARVIQSADVNFFMRCSPHYLAALLEHRWAARSDPRPTRIAETSPRVSAIFSQTI